MKNINKKKRARNFFASDQVGWLFILPSLLLFILVLAFPIGYAVRLSFFKVSIDMNQQFTGLSNYLQALQDQYFWNSIKNTLVYSFFSVFLSVVLGLLLALSLNSNWIHDKVRSLLHMLFLVPWTLSFVVTGSMWKWILNAPYGVFNAILRSLHLINENLSFFGDPTRAMPALIFVNVWRNISFAMVMVYAGLQLEPVEQKEAALVDGANKWQIFYNVTWPNLRGTITVSVVLLTIWTLIQFDLTQILTQGGGPNHATELISNLVYRQAFQYYDFGYGSAIAVLMLFLVLALTVIYVKVLKRD